MSMIYQKYSIFACIVLYNQICHSAPNMENQTDFIKSISEKLGIKSIFLVSQDKLSDGVFNIRKNLNEFSAFFTSILNFKTLGSNLLKIRGERILIVVPLNEHTLREITSISNAIRLSSFSWLCFSYSFGVNVTYFEDVYIPFDTKFLYASLDDGKILINEVYQVTENSDKLVNYYGTWDNRNGLVVVEKDFFERRRNFAQARLKFMLKNTVPDPFDPCMFGSLDGTADPPVFECLFFKIWKEFEIDFNFTLDYVLYPLTGSMTMPLLVMEKLRKKEVDGTVAPLMMTSARLLNNGFLWPISSTNLFAFSKVPDEEISFSSYFQPLSFGLWMATLAWLVIGSIFMILAKYIVIKVLFKEDFVFLRDGFDYVNASLSTLCSQSFSIDLEHRITFRVLIMVINVVPLFLFPAYSGSLISFLGNPSPKVPFSNLREFEENGKYELMALKPSFVHTFLLTDPKFGTTRQKNLVRAEDKMPSSDEYGFSLVCDYKLSYVIDQPVFLKEPPRCEIFPMDEHFGTFFAAMVVPTDCPYVELFNRVLQRRYICGTHLTEVKKLVVEKMNIEIVSRSWKDAKRMFYTSKFDHSRPFTFHNVLPIFVVLGVGLGLAIVLLAAEILLRNR